LVNPWINFGIYPVQWKDFIQFAINAINDYQKELEFLFDVNQTPHYVYANLIADLLIQDETLSPLQYAESQIYRERWHALHTAAKKQEATKNINIQEYIKYFHEYAKEYPDTIPLKIWDHLFLSIEQRITQELLNSRIAQSNPMNRNNIYPFPWLTNAYQNAALTSNEELFSFESHMQCLEEEASMRLQQHKQLTQLFQVPSFQQAILEKHITWAELVLLDQTIGPRLKWMWISIDHPNDIVEEDEYEDDEDDYREIQSSNIRLQALRNILELLVTTDKLELGQYLWNYYINRIDDWPENETKVFLQSGVWNDIFFETSKQIHSTWLHAWISVFPITPIPVSVHASLLTYYHQRFARNTPLKSRNGTELTQELEGTWEVITQKSPITYEMLIEKAFENQQSLWDHITKNNWRIPRSYAQVIINALLKEPDVYSDYQDKRFFDLLKELITITHMQNDTIVRPLNCIQALLFFRPIKNFQRLIEISDLINPYFSRNFLCSLIKINQFSVADLLAYADGFIRALCSVADNTLYENLEYYARLMNTDIRDRRILAIWVHQFEKRERFYQKIQENSGGNVVAIDQKMRAAEIVFLEKLYQKHPEVFKPNHCLGLGLLQISATYQCYDLWHILRKFGFTIENENEYTLVLSFLLSIAVDNPTLLNHFLKLHGLHINHADRCLDYAIMHEDLELLRAMSPSSSRYKNNNEIEYFQEFSSDEITDFEYPKEVLYQPMGYDFDVFLFYQMIQRQSEVLLTLFFERPQPNWFEWTPCLLSHQTPITMAQYYLRLRSLHMAELPNFYKKADTLLDEALRHNSLMKILDLDLFESPYENNLNKKICCLHHSTQSRWVALKKIKKGPAMSEPTRHQLATLFEELIILGDNELIKIAAIDFLDLLPFILRNDRFQSFSEKYLMKPFLAVILNNGNTLLERIVCHYHIEPLKVKNFLLEMRHDRYICSCIHLDQESEKQRNLISFCHSAGFSEVLEAIEKIYGVEQHLSSPMIFTHPDNLETTSYQKYEANI